MPQDDTIELNVKSVTLTSHADECTRAAEVCEWNESADRWFTATELIWQVNWKPVKLETSFKSVTEASGGRPWSIQTLMTHDYSDVRLSRHLSSLCWEFTSVCGVMHHLSFSNSHTHTHMLPTHVGAAVLRGVVACTPPSHLKAQTNHLLVSDQGSVSPWRNDWKGQKKPNPTGTGAIKTIAAKCL